MEYTFKYNRMQPVLNISRNCFFMPSMSMCMR